MSREVRVLRAWHDHDAGEVVLPVVLAYLNGRPIAEVRLSLFEALDASASLLKAALGEAQR